jgi:hypothetical protein
MSQSTFLPHAKPLIVWLWSLTFASLVITILCFIYGNHTGSLVALIITSGILAYVKSMRFYRVCLQPIQTPKDDPFYIPALLAAFAPLVCLIVASGFWSEGSSNFILDLVMAFAFYYAVKHFCYKFIFEAWHKAWQIEKRKYDKDRMKSDLNIMFASLGHVLNQEIQAENVTIYAAALQSEDVNQMKEVLAYFTSLKDADQKRRKLIDA